MFTFGKYVWTKHYITVHIYHVIFLMISASFLHKHFGRYANFIHRIDQIPLKSLNNIEIFSSEVKNLLKT